ncbi:MAG: siroheme synthase [Sphingomonadales bacterium 32-68-7]|nr:MAG: siroheme synthase [Sphingomonadales bacterium 12-68-11]OYX07555.1 MAG: siroheme synthase [Sphingomonadales bacterium 32-68-7]
MRALPLFHRVAGRPVIVLGQGPEADAKRRLVERAGGVSVGEDDTEARLAFVAEDEPEAAAARLKARGLLVNVVDRPELCDFTTPSVLDRDPLLIAIGSDGASAGLAKHVRLRLEALLPAGLGALAAGLASAREAIRARWPAGDERRRALDAALGEGGALDPLTEGAAERIARWIGDSHAPEPGEPIELHVSDDPDDLTLRQARLLGRADAVLHEPDVAPAILSRARADALRIALPHEGPMPAGLVLILRRG